MEINESIVQAIVQYFESKAEVQIYKALVSEVQKVQTQVRKEEKDE